MINEAGTYKAKAFEVFLGQSKDKKTPFVGVKFRITEGEFKGQAIRWEGWLIDTIKGQAKKSPAERTIESLQHCGWAGDNLADFHSGNLCGLDSNEVDLVIEMESYETESGEYKEGPKVRWVNAPGGGVQFQGEALDVAQAAQFGAKYRGLAMSLKAKSGATPAPPKAQQRPAPRQQDIAEHLYNDGNRSDDIPF